jgi:2,4-dienoyl-CoA reductase (NADPH2)
VRKAAQGRAEDINTCIACNQACLDHVFKNRLTSCLVNPRACHETELVVKPAPQPLRIAVVGAGPAGLTAAATLAERGHTVDLYEASDEVGGQLKLARVVPGKEEFHEMLRYMGRRLTQTGVRLHLRHAVDAETLRHFAHVVIATGVLPRKPRIPGDDHPKVCSYVDVLTGRVVPGRQVLVIGAGGIGFDVAEYLVHEDAGDATHPSAAEALLGWQQAWGVGDPAHAPGGLLPQGPQPTPAARAVTLLQRKPGKLGAGLGKTTGWIHRASLQMKQVRLIGGVNYERIGDEGLLISEGQDRRHPRWLACDTIVLCAGQEPLNVLAEALRGAAGGQAQGGPQVHVIGGALHAGELDAKRAIDQAMRLGLRL